MDATVMPLVNVLHRWRYTLPECVETVVIQGEIVLYCTVLYIFWCDVHVHHTQSY